MIYLLIIRRLAWRPGNLVTTSELIEYIWQDDTSGGPLDASKSIWIAILRHRDRLSALGWRIENCRARWRLALARKHHG